MRRIAFAFVALVSTGCAGILGLDEFTEGETGGPGAGGGTPSSSTTSSTSDATTSTGDGGSGAGEGGAGGSAPDPLDVTPDGPVKVGVLRALQFEASQAVTWTVDEAEGGRIDGDGLYIAPETPGTYHVTATSIDDPGESTTVTVTAAPLGVRLISGIAGGPGTIDGPLTRARLRSPGGVAQLPSNQNVIVADTASHTIRLIDRQEDELRTIAGVSGESGSVDGTGSDARFSSPTVVQTAQSGSLAWVVDGEGTCIRRVNAANATVTTLAGECGAGGTVDAASGDGVQFDRIDAMVLGPSQQRLFVCQDGTSAEGRALRSVDVTTGATVTHITGLGYDCRLATDEWRDKVYFAGGTASRDIKSFDDPFTAASVVSVVSLPSDLYYIDGLAAINGVGNEDDIYVSYGPAIWKHRVQETSFPATPYVGSEDWSSGGYVDGDVSVARISRTLAFSANRSYATLYFGDERGGTVRTLRDDQVATLAGLPPNVEPIDGPKTIARMPAPFALAHDEDGAIYVSGVDETDNVIRRIDPATGEISLFSGVRNAETQTVVDGPADEATFSFVIDMVRVGDDLYALDYFSQLVRRVSLADGSVSTLAGRANEPGFADGFSDQAQFDFSQFAGITTDGVDLFIADGGNSAIRKILLATGEVTTIAGGVSGTANGVGTDAQFLAPTGLAHDRGTLYVADAPDHVIRRIDLDTLEVTTLIGLSGEPGNDDGDAATAKLQNPFRLAADGLGNLFVTGGLQDGQTIRRVDLEEVRLGGFAGTEGQQGFVPAALPSTLGCPTALVVDAQGDLVFVDFCDGVVAAVRPL